MTPDLPHLLLISVVIAGAAAIKGAIGFGFPLIGVPLLSAIIGPRAAVPVMAVPTLLSNFILVSRGGVSPASPHLILALAGLAVGTLAGAAMIKALDPRDLSVLVGAVTLGYVAATALRLSARVSETAGRRAAPVIGLAAGVMGGATGIFSPIMAAYLHLLRLAKRDFVFWITMMFFVSNIVQIASYAHLGLYAGPVLALALIGCVPMAIGTWSGMALQDRLDPRIFGRVVLVIVFLAAVNLLVRGLLR
ncbi:MAG TPA: sulfite exporter TauE/SafE family protein [bacterium]|nr:sulfite exporter TauE/SafE family protein [bacterium]